MQGYIYSSLCGHLKLVPKAKTTDKSANSNAENTTKHGGDSSKIEDIISIVTSVNQRFAKVSIVCVRDVALSDPFRAQIRREDIREFEKDRIEMYKSFRPSDILLARVLSFGEANTGYLLTTAENELGVVIAKSESSGDKMVPVSWTEMQCPKTYNKEFRKIAKVIPENL